MSILEIDSRQFVVLEAQSLSCDGCLDLNVAMSTRFDGTGKTTRSVGAATRYHVTRLSDT